MRRCGLLKRTVGSSLSLAVVLFSILPGCTKMASMENFRMLDGAEKAAEAAEAELSACQKSHANLEQELADRKQKLADITDVRNTVQQALSE